MAQHDMNIANQGFPATRADINNALQAIATNNSGTSAPSTTFANQWWYDTANNKLYIRNEANNAWIQVAVLDQTNNEWQITTGVIQAKDGDGIVLKTDDGTARLSIDDSGNTSIGTVDGNPTGNHVPSILLAASGQINAHRDGGNPARFGSSVDGNLTEFYKQGALAGSVGIQTNGFYIDGEASHAGIRFSAGDFVPRQNGSDVDATIDLGVTTIRYKDLYLSGGAYLGGTTSANFLDDYEFGDWRPTMTAGSTAVTLEHQSTTQGAYTKIGKFVSLAAEIDVSNLNGGTGIISIGGLPFTVGNYIAPTGIEGSGSVGYWAGFSTAINNITLYAVSSSVLNFGFVTSTSTGPSDLTGTQLGTGEMRISISYYTS